MNRAMCMGSLALCLLCVTACAKKNSRAGAAGGTTGASGSTSSPCLAVVNGKSTSGYPAVVRLVNQEAQSTGFCTGTFISSVAVVTAAHCLSTAANGGIAVTFSTTISNGMEGIAAVNAFTQGPRGESVDNSTAEGVAEDMAILIFPADTGKGVMGIASTRPAVGATITSVGYGLTSLPDLPQDPNFNGSKHYGSEKVIAGEDDINIYTGDVTAQQSVDAAGGDVINSFGDSGSPLIYNDKLVGTLSSGGKVTDGASAGTYQDIFVDITSATSQKLIALANKGGAAISASTVTTPSSSAATTTTTTTTDASSVQCPTP